MLRPEDIELINQRFVGTEDERVASHWLNPANFAGTNFPGRQTRKYILRDDPETVVRINREDFGESYLVGPKDLSLIIQEYQQGAHELQYLNDNFGLAIPLFDFRLVRRIPNMDREILISEGNAEEARIQTKTDGDVSNLDYDDSSSDVYQSSLDLYVKSELVHGIPLDKAGLVEPELVAAAEDLYSELTRYYTEGFLAHPYGKFSGLADAIDAGQYVWGYTASQPDKQRLYFVDLEFKPLTFVNYHWELSTLAEIARIFLEIRKLEKQLGTRFTQTRNQINMSLVSLQGQNLEFVAKTKKAMKAPSLDVFYDQYRL